MLTQTHTGTRNIFDRFLVPFPTPQIANPGRFNPEFAKEQAAAAESKDTEGEEKAATIKKGDRCECAKGGKKRGEVMYVGKPEFAPGWWIGIKYDEPLGKNDGASPAA